MDMSKVKVVNPDTGEEEKVSVLGEETQVYLGELKQFTDVAAGMANNVVAHKDNLKQRAEAPSHEPEPEPEQGMSGPGRS